MLKIDLITVGKLKEDYLRRACEEYAKRLGSYCKLQILELPEYKVPQNPSEAHIANCIQQEGQSILAKIAPQSYVVAMCIEGKMLSSEDLAERNAHVLSEPSRNERFSRHIVQRRNPVHKAEMHDSGG